jgi:exopolyphosphatase/guanosine-5'-triphosphate,3'-diphosphate pyrophosphatase
LTTVAVVDLGSNSTRLLLAEVGGTVHELDRRTIVTRLGEGVDRTGRLSDAALARTFAATEEYARTCERLGAQRVRFVATSASRDAENRDAFVSGVRQRIGVEPQVVPGSEEAALSFAGATRELLADGLTGPFVVVDLGGGSTEVVRGGSSVEAALSVDIGCVRMTERHLADDPPSSQQIAAARRDIEAALDRVAEVVPLDGASSLVGLAGTVTTITACALGLECYDADRIHRTRLPVEQVREACDRLLHATRAERAALPYMHPGRVDVIGGGALIWRCVVDRLVACSGITEVVTSEHDILDGIAFSIA